MSLRNLTLTIAALSVGAFSAPAFAEELMHTSTGVTTDAFGVRATTVSFADLDVSHESGARALVVRIKQAAIKVCHYVDGPVDMATRQATTACVNKAMGEAVQASSAPLVAEIYHNATGLTASTGTPVTQ